MSNEADKIKERYEKRLANPAIAKHGKSETYIQLSTTEKELVFEKAITSRFSDISKIKVLEIGAGTGLNIDFFKKMGLQSHQIFANELIDERVQVLRSRHPDITIFPGDALEIDAVHHGTFDLVFQSTVFTSILSADFKQLLASKMESLAHKNGMLLWYDFIYNNPKNPDVKGVPASEVHALFPAYHFIFQKTTLAPPIGRRVGKMYPAFNFFPFLRTHVVGVGQRR